MTPTEPAATATPLRVVVVHWNQVDACIDTVDRFLDREVPVRVTVVDNGSTPQAVQRLRTALLERGERAELVEVGSNAGFGPGANVGLRRFLDRADDGDWVALAPHDVDPFPGCLAAALDAAASQPMAGLMCADVGDGMVPVIDPYFGGMVVAAPGPAFDPAVDAPRWEDAAYPHGTLMFLRRECLAEVGLFDERFFSYCEEADLALRARRAGWSIGLVRGARVQNIHIGSGVAVVDYLQTRNTLLLVQEMSGWYHAFVRACFTLTQVVRGFRDPSTRPPIFDARARLLGIRDFGLRRFGPPPTTITTPPSQFDPAVHGQR